MQSLIEIGEAAPKISAKCYYPANDEIRKYSLGSDMGKWVILTFYPGDFTFVCATDVEAFAEIHEKFMQNGAEIYAISTDSIFSHKQWSKTSPRVKKSNIPLIEDFTKRVSTDYGFLCASTGAARRGTVIIDPDGKVQYLSIHNDDLGKDADHVFNSFMGLKYIRDHPTEAGKACKIPANWKVGKETLKVDTVKDIGAL